MKYVFPIFALVGGLGCLACAGDLDRSEQAEQAMHSPREGGVDTTGQQMVAEAAELLLEHVTLQARVRQRVFLFDRRLTGSGVYYQAQARDRIVSRLDVKLPVGDKVMVLQQINDGDYLWTQRDLAKNSSIGRVDLRRVRHSPVGANLSPAQQLAMGGISQLMHGLHEQFEFQPPKAAKLGEMPVWVLHGSWRLPGRGGEGTGDPRQMPQLPDSVILLLSRGDSLPLFPFRVEYARHRAEAQGKATRTPIMAVDFFEVRVGGDLDGRLFTFTAGDRDLTDDTERFLRELGG